MKMAAVEILVLALSLFFVVLFCVWCGLFSEGWGFFSRYFFSGVLMMLDCKGLNLLLLFLRKAVSIS